MDEFSYDDVPYPSYVFPQASPDNLSTLAQLHGIPAAPPDRARVLELGCANGANLLSSAYMFPESEFVGVDLSPVQIADARRAAEEIGCGNITFIDADLCTVDHAALGSFDFVIAHGVFSWVPPPVREALLALTRRCLAPNGVAYISYNAYPGCLIRQIAIGAIEYHTAALTDPVERADQARAVMKFIWDAAEEDSVYKKLLLGELNNLNARPDAGILHDELASVKTPFYISEFASMIAEHGLQYVFEARPSGGFLGKIPRRAHEALSHFADDIIRREQYIDFITCRRFRETIICHANVEIERDRKPEQFAGLFFTSQFKAASADPDLKGHVPVKFLGENSETIETDHPLTKAILYVLQGESDTIGTPFEDLISRAGELIGVQRGKIPESDLQRVIASLWTMKEAKFVAGTRFQPKHAEAVSDRPVASAFARWQIRRSCETLANLAGAIVKPEPEIIRPILQLLDGTRDRHALLKDLVPFIDDAQMPPDELEELLAGEVENHLKALAGNAMLVA